jgi:hypothetical protein
VSPTHLSCHLRVARYDDFLLTDAVRPAVHVPVRPREGFRRGHYRDPRSHRSLPILNISVSAERLFDTFLALLEPLGEVVDVVLESSHGTERGDKHHDFRRNDVDRPILASYCCDFEDLLLHDGCTGLAVLSTTAPMEVQFDEHKQLIVYARATRPFRRLLRELGIPEVPDLQLISEADHWHSSSPRYAEEFKQFCQVAGAGNPDAVVGEWD